MPVRAPPRLVVVDITSETSWLDECAASKAALNFFLETIVDSMHPHGTLAFAVPRPSFSRGADGGGTNREAFFRVLRSKTVIGFRFCFFSCHDFWRLVDE